MKKTRHRTSELLLLDLADATARLRRSDSDAIWLGRELDLLQALMPVVTFLEQAGHAVPPSTIGELDELEKMLGNACRRYGPKFRMIAFELRKYLSSLPFHRATFTGRQPEQTRLHHEYVFAMMLNMDAAASARRP